MRIYLAARYSRHNELQRYAKLLASENHKITSRWILGGHQITDEGLSAEADEKKRKQFAKEDLEDLKRADTVISFTEIPRSTNSRGGRHVEFGIAYALNKICIVIGPRENVFHCMGDVLVYDNFEDFFEKLVSSKDLNI